MEKENLMQHAITTGAFLTDELRAAKGVERVTGRGLMLGVRFNHPVAALRKLLLEEFRIFTGSASDKHVIRLLPPYCITNEDAQKVVNAFSLVSQLQTA